MAKAGASRYAGDSRKMEIACESKTVVKQFVDSLLGTSYDVEHAWPRSWPFLVAASTDT